MTYLVDFSSGILEHFVNRRRREVSMSNHSWYFHNNETINELIWFSYTAEVVFGVLYNIIAIVGISANALVLVKMCINPKLRTPSNHFITNLAIADLVALLTLIVTRNLIIVFGMGAEMKAFLITIQYTQHLCVQSTAFVLAAMSFTRYHFTVHPLKARAEWTSSRVWKLCGAIWIISAILYIPIIFSALYVDDTGGWTRFVPIPLKRKLFSTIRLFPMFIIPAAVILTSYCKIVLTFKQREKILEKKAASSITFPNTVSGQTKKLTRMVTVIILVYFLCWGPYQIYITGLDLRPYFLQSTALRWKAVVLLTGFLRLLAYIGCALNPFIYAYSNPAFLKVRKPNFKAFFSSKETSSENTLSTRTAQSHQMSV
ncbi:G-protein coupled receptor 54 [Holothuria leucospilota]|uniref:G-protein coupled receptor 54 n=1 Tax=Holothuria leucospilota TaxID=206669 RepID=A0A9Q1H0Q7_HOLLE|nr:G-protein coupled receptor 54 [Holothuria leucospilota]